MDGQTDIMHCLLMRARFHDLVNRVSAHGHVVDVVGKPRSVVCEPEIKLSFRFHTKSDPAVCVSY